MREFFDMGGYAFYVWTSYGLTVVVLGANLVAIRLRGKRIKQQLQRRLRRDA